MSIELKSYAFQLLGVLHNTFFEGQVVGCRKEQKLVFEKLSHHILLHIFWRTTCIRENIVCKPLASERCLEYIIRTVPLF